MNARRLVLTLLVLAAVLTSGSLAAPFEPTRLTSLSASFLADRVRLTVDFRGARPAFDVSFRPEDSSVAIDLRGVDPGAVRVPVKGPDALVVDWQLTQPNFLSVVWAVRLDYPVPADCIRTHLTDTQLQVEILRGFDVRSRMKVTRSSEWRRREVRSARGYVLVNELEVDLRKGASLKLVHANDSLQAVKDPVELAGQRPALAFINGGFFTGKAGSLGLVVEDGKILKEPVGHRPPRTALGITSDGRILMDRVAVKDGKMSSVGGGDWSSVVTALGVGPRLVRDGRVDVTAKEEGLGPGGNDITRRCARSAVAVLGNGHLLLVTISGYRDNHSQGWSLEELASWLCERGAKDAMGLDGGGSTAMVLDGRLVSRTWAHRGVQRKVANGLAIVDGSRRLLPARITVALNRQKVPADGKTMAKVVAKVFTASGAPVADGTMVFFSTTAGRITAGFATKHGKAVAWWTSVRRPGQSRVLAYAGLVSAEGTLSLEAGPPARLAARVVDVPTEDATPAPVPTPESSAPSPAARKVVEVLVTDAAGNPLPSQPVLVELNTGAQTVKTGADGVGRVELSPDDAGGRVRLSRAGLPPLDVTL